MALNGNTATDRKGGGGGLSRPSAPPAFDEEIQRVKRKYEKAYQHINQALNYDEQKQVEQAVASYLKGIRHMNAALAVWSQLCHDRPNETKESRMGSKMEKISVNLVKAQKRVDELLAFSRSNVRPVNSSRTPAEPPPSYNAAMSQQHRPPMNSASAASAMADAKLLFFIEGGVQIYFISNDGNVSAPSYPSSLAVYQFLDKGACQTTVDSPPAFLQVGDWIYPLMPSISPALHADWGAYIFPDVTAREAGCYVGVIIPDTLDVARRQRLEEILQTFTKFREQVPGAAAAGEAEAVSDTTGTISKGIKTAAEWISWGLTKGAEKTGQFVKYGSDKLRQNMDPEQEPSKIDPRVQNGAQYARTATAGAVKISGYLVDKVGQATSALAKTVAPHVRRTSESLLPESWSRKDPSSGRSTLDKISEVASSGLQGFSTVYLGLERSAMILAKNVADQTVQTVQYKYGQDAGHLTEDVVHSVSNVVVATTTVNQLGIKAVAQQVAKEKGAETVNLQAQGTGGVASAPPPVDKSRPQKVDQMGPPSQGSKTVPLHTDKSTPPPVNKTGLPNGNRNSLHQPRSGNKGPPESSKKEHPHADKKGLPPP